MLLVEISRRSIDCMGNILLAFDPPKFLNTATVWKNILVLCNEIKSDSEMLEGVTASLWTLLRKAPHLIRPEIKSVDVLEGLLHLGKHPNVQVRIHALGAIGILTAFYDSVDITSKIMELALASLFGFGGKSLSNPQNVSVLIEASNIIFDNFAKRKYNTVVQKYDAVTKLTTFAALLENKIQQQKDFLDDEIKDDLDALIENLHNFIKYKNK